MIVKFVRGILRSLKPKLKDSTSTHKDLYLWCLKVQYLLSTILYINEKLIGLVVNIECTQPGVAWIRIDSPHFGTIYVIDFDHLDMDPIGFVIYERSEIEKNWIVDEMPTIQLGRLFRIQANPNFS